MEILNTENITNVSVRNFLENKLFPNLRLGLQELVDIIHENGELEKYWSEVEKQNEDARRAARRLEKERRKLELGSDYEESGSDHEEQNVEEQEEEEDELEGEEDEEEEEEEEEPEYIVGPNGEITEEVVRKRQKKSKKKLPPPEPQFIFNPVKFLAATLQSISETGKVPERVKGTAANIEVKPVKAGKK